MVIVHMRDKLLEKIAELIIRIPRTILIIAILLTAICTWYSATHLELNTDQDDLVSEKLDYHKRYKDYLREFGDTEYLYVVVEIDNNLPLAKKFVKALAERLKGIPEIKEITYQISNPVLEKSFLLYLSTPQLDQIKSFLGSGPTSVTNLAKWDSLSSTLNFMNGLMERPEPQSHQDEMRSGFQFFNELIGGMDTTLKTGRPYEPKIANVFLGSDQAIDEDGFLLTPNGKLLFVLIMPEKRYDTLSVIEEPLKKIRNALKETKNDFPDINAGLTGRPVLQADEMSVTNRDTTRGTILAILAVTILFVLYFRRLTRPLMAIISLIFGISWTFGLATLVIGYLNLLSSVFAIILVGAGIEFGLQIVSRYRENLDRHKDPKLAVKTCVTKTGHGNITAALTTAAAFYSVLFTGFKALTELGFIAGTGIILCLASLIIVLPTMMYLYERNRPKHKLKTRVLVNLSGIDQLYNRPKLLLAMLIIITIAGLPGLKKLSFDHNLLNLQAEGLESVEYEKMIIDKSDDSTWYAVSISKTPGESTKIARQMRLMDSVGKVETIEAIIPPDQDEKTRIIGDIRKSFDKVSYSKPAEGINKDILLYNLASIIKNLGRFTELAFGSGYTDAVDELDNLNSKTQSIYAAVLNASDEQMKALAEFQTLFITKFRESIKMLEGGLEPSRIKVGDLPASIRNRFISGKNRFATYVYPKFNIWEPDKMRDFIQDIRGVDPQISGTPVEVFESSRLMQNSFQKAASYALFIIIIIVLIDFKRPRDAFLALAPLFAGVLWLLEVMGWAGIPFNLANFFAIPILLGVGVDNGVQLVHRYLQEGRTVKIMSTSTGAAILLTSLTTGISFGALTISQHRGIQSLGLIMTLGAITCLVGSMVLLPTILKLISKK